MQGPAAIDVHAPRFPKHTDTLTLPLLTDHLALEAVRYCFSAAVIICYMPQVHLQRSSYRDHPDFPAILPDRQITRSKPIPIY